MIKKLEELRNSGSEEGFTLIELMIVVVIIGILAAIAIPIFANQQKGAIAAGVKSDVKNLNTQIATLLVKKPTAGNVSGTSVASAGAASITVKVTDAAGDAANANNSFSVNLSDAATSVVVAGAWNTYTITATNNNADPTTVTYTASTGKLS